MRLLCFFLSLLLLAACSSGSDRHAVSWNSELYLPHNQVRPLSLNKFKQMLDERFDQDEYAAFSIEVEEGGQRHWLQPASCSELVRYRILNTRKIRFSLASVWQDYCRAMQVAVQMQPYEVTYVSQVPSDYFKLLAPMQLSDCCDAWRTPFAGMENIEEVSCVDTYTCSGENSYATYEMMITSIGDYNGDGLADVSLLSKESYTEGTGMAMFHLIVTRTEEDGPLQILEFYPQPPY